MEDPLSNRHWECLLPTFRHEAEFQVAGANYDRRQSANREAYRSRFAITYGTERQERHRCDRSFTRAAANPISRLQEARARQARSLSAAKQMDVMPTDAEAVLHELIAEQTSRTLSRERILGISHMATLSDTRFLATLQLPLAPSQQSPTFERPVTQYQSTGLPPKQPDSHIRAVHTQSGTLFLRTTDEYHDQFVARLQAEIQELKHQQHDLPSLQEEYAELQDKLQEAEREKEALVDAYLEESNGGGWRLGEEASGAEGGRLGETRGEAVQRMVEELRGVREENRKAEEEQIMLMERLVEIEGDVRR